MVSHQAGKAEYREKKHKNKPNPVKESPDKQKR